MTAATRAGRIARPAAVSVALCAALLALAPGCKRQGASTSSQAAEASVAPAPSPAADPALNWGGTTPHDTPPVRDPLIEQADAIMRKADPGFDRFEVNYLTGDLDRDGRDDVAIEYGIGEEGAMRHVAKRIRVLLARAGRLELQPDQTDRFADCPVLREIRDGRLWADGLEACMLPFPRTLAYYQFEWRDGGLRRVAKEDPAQRIRSRLQAMRETLLAGKIDALDDHLRPGPMPGDAEAPAPDRLFAEAGHRRGFVDAVGALAHLPLQRVERSGGDMLSAQADGPHGGERMLQIEPAAEGTATEVGRYTYVVDARAYLDWPESGGVGYRTVWRLIEGELYLEQAEEMDTESSER
ncbi:hypothetical protein PRJ39_12465 [Lysobacter enzymogenes]|uniref:hypothetical protein n=1 Tax=Lysobacter enzymogenes TaxID=69 RepID=UPI003748E228